MRLLIDTDAGVDDTLALVYAARSPELQIEAVTTVSGNVPVHEVTQNVLFLKELLGLEAPVFSGAEVPRARKLVTAPEVHGVDGVGGYRHSRGIRAENWETKDAAQRIVSSAKKYGKKLTIVSLGPMTNLANAVAIDAEVMSKVSCIIQMGGVFAGYGNTTEYTEFNIFVDPEAADFVLANGMKVKFVPLDLTERLFLPRGIGEQLLKSIGNRDRQLAGLLRKALRFYMRYHRRNDKLDGCFLHDPIALAAAVNPAWFKFEDAFVSVETNGNLTSGMTIADFRKKRHPKNSEIAVSFDARNFLRDFTLKVFGVKLDSNIVDKRCLKMRFSQPFNNTLHGSA
jgi:inosine-uridine nucleoside N-ribohydrolase